MKKSTDVFSLDESLNDGSINDYMGNKIRPVIESEGISQEVVSEVVADAIRATTFGIDSEKEYGVYFYSELLIEDIARDTFNRDVDAGEKDNIVRLMLSSIGSEYKFDNLTDYRIIMHKYFNDPNVKFAHPNIAGKDSMDTLYDVRKWIDGLKGIYAMVHEGSERRTAVDSVTADWDSDERKKFGIWMKFYEDGNAEKYNVRTAGLFKTADDERIHPAVLNRINRGDSDISLSTRPAPQKTQREMNKDRARIIKKKMQARVHSIRKLLDEYNLTLPEENVSEILRTLNQMGTSVSSLKSYATIQDSIIRSANRVEKLGFVKGATELREIANDNQLAVFAELDISRDAAVKEATDRLENISKLLKSRNMIRELASIDILLDKIGLASFFPELTDAQAKLIDSFGYSSNKIESIVAKLRGSNVGNDDNSDKTNLPTHSPAESKPKLPEPQTPDLSPTVKRELEPLAIETQDNKDDSGDISLTETMQKPIGDIKKLI